MVNHQSGAVFCNRPNYSTRMHTQPTQTQATGLSIILTNMGNSAESKAETQFPVSFAQIQFLHHSYPLSE